MKGLTEKCNFYECAIARAVFVSDSHFSLSLPYVYMYLLLMHAFICVLVYLFVLNSTFLSSPNLLYHIPCYTTHTIGEAFDKAARIVGLTCGKYKMVMSI